jgi:flagellar biosynthesis protein FliR
VERAGGPEWAPSGPSRDMTDIATFIRQIAESLLPGADPGQFLFAMALTTARIAAVLHVLPPLGSRLLPASARLVLALVLAYGMLGPFTAGEMPPVPLAVLLLLKETVLGFVLGVLASLPFHFMQQAGYLVDAGRGGAMSRLLSQTGDESATPFANLFFFVTVLFFFSTPAGAAFWQALDASFRAFPPLPASSTLPAAEPMLLVTVAAVGKIFLLSIMLALPVLLLVLVVDVLTGVVGRFSPLAGGYFVSMPLRTAAGIGGGALALTFMTPVIESALSAALVAMDRIF